jgi:hypothetical protein
MITVVHKDSPITISATRFYIGRPSPLGNPFKIGAHGTREQVIHRYEQWLAKRELDNLAVSNEMKKILKFARIGDVELACYCAPLACHGDVIKKRVEYLLNQK